MTGLTWEEGIIGRIEHFLLRRYPIGKMWARAIATSIVSVSLSQITLEDKWGEVKANVWFANVAKSGLGYKTPLIRFARKIVAEFNKEVFAPPKFTPEGFTEWVIGVRKKKPKDGEEERQTIKKHYVCFIIRDEWTKLLGETRQKYLIMKEYLSELWDGWIEGYYTRKYQYEGNVPVYVVLLSASSDLFFDLLDEAFFKQGLGNRILWIIEDNPEPKKLDPKDFFFAFGVKDEEFTTLLDRVVEDLRTLAYTTTLAFIHEGAAELWTEYQHECAVRAHKARALVGSYEVKQPLNALKLSVIYAASRLDIHESIINVRKEDMERAIADAKIYTKMWHKAMELWEEVKGRQAGREERIPTSKYDLGLMMEVALAQEDHLFSVGTIRSPLDLPDTNRISRVIQIGRDKKWLEIAAEMADPGDLTGKQYERFKPNRGFSPRIYRVTETGRLESKSIKSEKAET